MNRLQETILQCENITSLSDTIDSLESSINRIPEDLIELLKSEVDPAVEALAEFSLAHAFIRYIDFEACLDLDVIEVELKKRVIRFLNTELPGELIRHLENLLSNRSLIQDNPEGLLAVSAFHLFGKIDADPVTLEILLSTLSDQIFRILEIEHLCRRKLRAFGDGHLYPALQEQLEVQTRTLTQDPEGRMGAFNKIFDEMTEGTLLPLMSRRVRLGELIARRIRPSSEMLAGELGLVTSLRNWNAYNNKIKRVEERAARVDKRCENLTRQSQQTQKMMKEVAKSTGDTQTQVHGHVIRLEDQEELLSKESKKVDVLTLKFGSLEIKVKTLSAATLVLMFALVGFMIYLFTSSSKPSNIGDLEEEIKSLRASQETVEERMAETQEQYQELLRLSKEALDLKVQ
jgi:hypothetical protein